MTEPPAATLEHVELIEEEVVRAGGPSTVNWLVRRNDGWVRAQSHPSAQSERLERGSGIVWRTRVTLVLPRGTALRRLESRPVATTKSALEHLTGGSRGAKRRSVERAYFVAAGGAVVPVVDDRA